MRFMWLSMCVFASTVMAFQSSLSETQCARYFKEYQNLALQMNATEGEALQSMANRYGRLQERLDAFCQHTQFTTSESRVDLNSNNISEPEKIKLFSDELKQRAWEAFYTPPSYCVSGSMSSVNKLRCKNELDRFKELFEQQWQQNNASQETELAVETENNASIGEDNKNIPSQEAQSNALLNPAEKKESENQHEVADKPISANSFNPELAEQTTGLDTLFFYMEDYLLLLVLLLVLLISIRILVPALKKLFTKHFSYVAVNKYLMKHLPVSDYTLYSKISLPISSGVADIDELVLSPFGIFVISCQSQTGRIYADTTSEVWTEQVGKNRHNFPNPSKQLPLKIAGVKQLFGISEHIHGLIVFDQEVDFRTNMPSNVIQTGQLLAKIEHFEETVFTHEQISHFVLLLSEYKTSNPFKEIISNLGQKAKTNKSEWES